jgi:uncharacterized protein YjbJ (UPF0337 family)
LARFSLEHQRGAQEARRASCPIHIFHQECAMNSDQIKGKWKQLKGRLKSEWGKLTDDDVDYAEGHRDYLVGKLQERYGMAREEADRQIKRFEQSL